MSPLFILLLSSTLLAANLGEQPEFKQGQNLYEELEFEQALFRFQKVSIDPSLTPEERAQVMTWTALCYAGVGNELSAKQALKDAVAIDPKVALPKVASPKLKEWMADTKIEASKNQVAQSVPSPDAKAPDALPKTPPTAKKNLTTPPASSPEESILQSTAELPPEPSAIGPMLLLSGAGIATVGIVAAVVAVGFIADDVLNIQPQLARLGALENPSSTEQNSLAAYQKAQKNDQLITLVSGIASGVAIALGLGVMGSSFFFE